MGDMSSLFGHKKIPSSPGIYFFSAGGGKETLRRVLYIGKAANLKKRLNSYKKAADLRIQKMLETASKLDWQETGSEIEALILESQLIKKHRPLFNIMLRDDKQYFYVGITHSTGSKQAKEEFPRIFLTHQPRIETSNKRQGARKEKKETWSLGSLSLVSEYMGPFTEGASIKTTLKLLRKIFPYCTCKQKHNRYCLNYHIGNCLGFCCLNEKGIRDYELGIMEEQRKEYGKNIKAVKDILNGKRIPVLNHLQKEIGQLGENQEFEKAIVLRDKIAKLEKVFANAKVIKQMNYESGIMNQTLKELAKVLQLKKIPERIEGYDVSNIQGRFATGSMVVFTPSTLRDASGQASSGQATYHPDKNEYRKFKIRTVSPDQGGDVAMLKEMLTRRFNHPEWQFPDLILIDGGKGQLNTALSVIPKNISVIALTKDKKHRGHHVFSNTKKTATPLFDWPLPVKNLILFIDSEAHRFAISYYRKLHRKTI